MNGAVARVAGPDNLVRWVLAAAGASILAGTAAALADALPFSIRPSTAWLLMQMAVACGLCALGWRVSWRRAAVAAASLWAGGAAQLALTQPLWFQYLRLQPTSLFEAALWGVIAMQALTAAAMLLTAGGVSGGLRLAGRLGPARVTLFVLLILGVCVGAGRLIADQAYLALAKQILASAVLVAVNLASLAALAVSLPGASLTSGAGRLGQQISLPGETGGARALDRWIPWLAAGLTLLSSIILCLAAFGRSPHLADEVAYLFQARYLAEGVISAPAPPEAVRAALAYDFLMIRDGRWFAITPPGWPAVLAIGVRLGVPWLVNPILGAASVLLAHAVVSRLASRGSANLVALFMATSPWLIATSASLMTHALTLFAALAAMLLLIKARDGRPWAAFGAGAAMGLVFLTRPMDGLVAGGLAGVWALAFLRRPGGWLAVLAYGLGCLALGGLIFPYNAHLVGDPLLPPLTLYQDLLWGPGSNRIGFGPDIGPPDLWLGVDLYRGHSPFEALLLVQLNAYSLNWELLGWPALSLVLVFAWIVWGRRSAFELSMAAFTAATVFALALYWYADSFYIGPRYLFLCVVPLIILSVSGAQAIAERLSGAGALQAGERLGVVILLMCLFSLVVFTTWRGVTRYHDHRDFHAGYRSIAEGLPGGLIFVASPVENDVASALAWNSPFLRPDRPLFLRDLGPAARAAAARTFPDRRQYLTTGRGKDGADPELVPYTPAR